eukprot:gene5119-30369_t
MHAPPPQREGTRARAWAGRAPRTNEAKGGLRAAAEQAAEARAAAAEAAARERNARQDMAVLRRDCDQLRGERDEASSALRARAARHDSDQAAAASQLSQHHATILHLTRHNAELARRIHAAEARVPHVTEL